MATYKIQVFWIGDDPTVANFEASLVFRDLTLVRVRHLAQVHFGRTIKQVFQVFVELALMRFHRQHLIGTLIHDGFGNVGLTAQRIDRHKAAFQRQDAQQFRYRGDFIGFVVNFTLSQD
jgi:hypothetical protein